MTPERWHQITSVFEAALLRGAGERRAFLDAACGGDEGLRREVEAMLASHEEAPDFMAEPAAAVAAGHGGGDGASLAGQSFAHYQVLARLGSGGMGDVYLARDTRLGRKVALKFLPDYLAGDERRASMFTREARAASALNHPNIVTVYDLGEADGRYFIAMEYVEGETLGQRIHRERDPLPKLLNYLRQAAEGLTKAHAAGVVHRDLKPDNVMVTRDGFAKVLDFGLAKQFVPPGGADGGGGSEAATAVLAPQSLPGMVMGTAGYMSPEQAQGRVREIDHRSDIFSFGCILYEAATGRKAFEGADALDSLHKIVHAPTPQIREAIPHAPADLERIVRRCLQKDPEKRYQSIKDVALELEELQQELQRQPAPPRPAPSELNQTGALTGAATKQAAPPAAPTAEAAARPTSSAEYLVGELKRHKTGVIVVAAALILIAVGGAALLLVLTRRDDAGGAQAADGSPVSFGRMRLTRLTTTGRASDATVSPDGKYVAYLNIETRGGPVQDGGTASVWIRQVATGRDIRIVEPDDFIVRGMTFSPDGNYLYYRARKAGEGEWVLRIPALGGDAQKLIRDPFSPISFSPDGKRIAFVRNHSPAVGDSTVIVANADGTGERIVTTHRGAELFATPARPTAPAWSPDGRVLICALGRPNDTLSLLEVQLEGGAERQIGTQRWSNIDSLAWLPDGSGLMLSARDQSSPQSQVWRVAYPSGEAHRVTNDLNEYHGMSLSGDAQTMAVVQSARDTDLWVMPAGRPASEARAVTSGTGKADGSWGISWTPDGKIVYGSNASGNRDIWLLDTERGTQKQLTSDARQNFYPQVTPDGSSILFLSDRGDEFGIWRMDTDGGNPRQLIAATVLRFTISPDGRWLVYSGTGAKGIPALWRARVDGGERVELNNEYWEEHPAVSPDGKQIAFQYFLLGTRGMSIGQIPIEGGPITRIAEPPFRLGPVLRWTPDGKAIAYIDNRGEAGQIYALPAAGGPPRQLTDFKSDSIFWFDFSRDGKQLALARGTQTSDVVLISNFR
ncbi:MAG TPA: protein kinase [Pyrinomonadaceae bacterium]|nr:protein kinase [Pyrinomonadaceae bacterium]